MEINEVLKLPAGNKLDRIIAVEVLGYTDLGPGNYPRYQKPEDVKTSVIYDVPAYSASDTDAQIVLRFLGDRPKAKWTIETNCYADGMQYWVMYNDECDDWERVGMTDHVYEDPSLALAICKAALMFADWRKRH